MTPEHWRQIEDLYHAAQERSPADRAVLLECTDPGIRARVERMLALNSVGQILDRPAADFLDSSMGTMVAAGAQFGPYRIEAPIGAGGMGTVYRAIDTRLGRAVAIKIAAERYSERFQLEARAISTLNHPHVCTLHDVGANYLVMEFIDGSTLAAEIMKGPLAPETAARYGAQIAGALAEAHELGIVHRDLKPSNVMVTRHGVKVLDFGLAKVLSTTGITESNGVMGTPAYMAPEQVEGRDPSSVTDLFSLGLVLYEMAVGKLPFPGASLGQMLSSGAQTAVPQPSRERVGLPASLDGLVARLLEKDPAKRPQSASEVARELSALADRLAAPPPRFRWRSVYVIPVAALLLGLALVFYLRTKAPGSQLPIPNNPSSYTQLTSFTDSAVWPSLSPDGRMLAFFRSDKEPLTSDQIWVKLLPNGEPVQVTHDPRLKHDLAFSPDGSRIAYGVLEFPFSTYTVSSLGGDSELMLPNAAGLTWLDDRHVLFSQAKAGLHIGLVTSTTDRSEVREIYFPTHERGIVHHSYASPDQKWILSVETVWEDLPCRLVPFDGGSIGRQVGAPGVPCLSAAWSPDGKWMYLGLRRSGRRHLWRQRFPDGQPEQITFGSNEESGMAVAPDGRSLVTSIVSQQNSIWIHDPLGDRALSTEGYAESPLPVFSSDGKHLYYLLRHDSPEAPAELWRADLASGKSEVVVPGFSIAQYDISNDETEAVFSTQPDGQPYQLWIAPLDRSTPPRRIAAAGEAYPHFGPKGQVVFRLSDGKAFYVGAINRDGTGERKAVSAPISDVREISPDRHMVIVIGAAAGIQYSKAGALLAVPLDDRPARPVHDSWGFARWSPNGRYFYVEMIPASRDSPGRTAAIPVPPGKTLPPFPADAVHNLAAWANIPGVKIVEHASIAPGPDPSIYAYVKSSVHANLFRIPLR
jgi:eukaryotic-like serine/threonine-protein kinase